MSSCRLVLSEDNCLGRHTPEAGRHKGHFKSIIMHVCVLIRGELESNFHEDHIMDYGLRKLWQRTEGTLLLPEGAFSSAGVEGNERKRKAATLYFPTPIWVAVVVMYAGFLSESQCDSASSEKRRPCLAGTTHVRLSYYQFSDVQTKL